MKTYIRRREKNNSLVIFFGTWGTDENVFTPSCNDDFDLILFYNYSADEALILPEMKTYEKIVLIGWSLGVWAAGYFSEKTGIIADISIAVNGTPVPADNQYGITLNVFEETLNNITETNIENFYLRMFGDKKTYLANIDRVPKRSLKSLHDELRWLYNRIMEPKDNEFKWDYAVTSETDHVFPSENMHSYWEKEKDTKHIVLPLPHYFFDKWTSFADFIAFVESYEPMNPKQKKSELKRIKGL